MSRRSKRVAAFEAAFGAKQKRLDVFSLAGKGDAKQVHVKNLAHLFKLCSHGWMHHPRWTWVFYVSRFLVCLAAITSLWGCTPAITWQALQAQGLGPKIVNSCIRPPPFGERGEFYTYNDTSHEMVSDEDAEAFWEAARTAGTIYRYDPNAPALNCTVSEWNEGPLN